MINIVLLNADPQYEDINRKYIDKCSKLNLLAVFDNAENILEFLKKNAVDAVFIDCDLYHFDTTGFIQDVRNCNLTPQFIITTVADNTDELSKIEYVGVFEIIIKPFGYAYFSKIVDSLEKYLKHGGRIRESAGSDERYYCDDDFDEFEQIVLELISEKEMSASEISNRLGLSKVTIRQCLNRLSVRGAAEIRIDNATNAVVQYRKKQLF